MQRTGALAAEPEKIAYNDFIRCLRELQSKVQDLIEAADPAEIIDAPSDLRCRIRAILKLRASRQRIFGTRLFGEPAWDMILTLLDADLSGRKESVSGAYIASGVPPTTALRSLRDLEREGWVEREPDLLDRRRCFVRLTEQGRACLIELFQQSATNPQQRWAE
jgi:hypothetical protein